MHKSGLLLSLLALLMVLGGCKTSQNTPTVEAEPLPEHVIANEFIVQMKSGKATDLTTAFNSYGLRVKKTINERMRMWLFEYNSDSLPAREMLSKLKASELVSSAEFNKSLGDRK